MDLQELSDRAEINDVLIRYTRAIDTGDWDRLDTVFTPDAQIDYTESGGIAAAFPEVKPWLAEMLPAFFPMRMHTLGQVEIRLDGDSAEVSAYFHNPMPMDDGKGGTKLVEIGGIYHHTMTRTPDGWRSRAAARRSRLEAEHLMAGLPEERPDGLDSPGAVRFIKLMSRAQVRVFKLTNGRVGNKWRIGAGWQKPVPTLLLTHVGRKSGKEFETPLLYLEDGPRPRGRRVAGRAAEEPAVVRQPARAPRHDGQPQGRAGPAGARPHRDRRRARRRCGRGWSTCTPTSRSTRSGPTGRSRSWSWSRR